jgi:hypothetical protein
LSIERSQLEETLLSEYAVERKLLLKHANSLNDLHDDWKGGVQDKLNHPSASADSSALTAAGSDFGSAFTATASDYQTYVAGVLEALSTGYSTLRFTSRTYGKAEAAVTEGLRKMQAPRSVGRPGGLEKLFP